MRFAAGNRQGFSLLLLLIVIPIILIGVVIVYIFTFQPNMVVGDTMYPTFPDKAYLLSQKISYHFLKPQRGDVVIFRSQKNPDMDVIDRIVGLPGETIEIKNGNVFVNGSQIDEPYVKVTSDYSSATQYLVPPDSYFVLGDNRQRSNDLSPQGFTPAKNIYAKVIGCISGCNPGPLPQKPDTVTQQQSLPGSELTKVKISYNPTSHLEIRGDKIFDNGSELFYNVTNVSAVRLGPTGRTIQFQRIDPTKYNTPRCADFDGSVDLPYSGSTETAKLTAPWDFNNIGYAFSLPSCGGGYDGAFLKHSNQYAYLQIDDLRNGTLIIQNLDNQKQFSIPLDKDIVDGLLPGSNTSETAYGVTINYEKNGYAYLYPQDDTFVYNNRLLITFGKLILEVDESNGKIVDIFSLASTKSFFTGTSFSLASSQSAPLAVIGVGWEGGAQYMTLLDYNSDKLSATDLTVIDKSGFDVFGLRNVSWQINSVLITTYNQINIPEEDYNGSYPQIKNFSDQVEISAAEKIAEGKIQKDNPSFLKVKCILGPGEIGGCFALKEILTYKYVSGSGKLIKQ